MTQVCISALGKRYPDALRPAVDAFSLKVASGELVALLGPSGCGKTTVLRMVAGLLTPSEGTITFDGKEVQDQQAEDRGAVMVFQNPLLFPYMSVAENVGFGLKMRHVAKAEIVRRVGEMLDRVQLAGLGARRPDTLSGGQQQRVALARALIVQPKILLLDEPLSNLDAHLRAEMRTLIRTLQQDLAITTIFVTHDREEAVVMADQIALMLEGQLVQTGKPEAFFNQPANAAVAQFFGGQNFVTGSVGSGVFQSSLGPLRLPAGVADGPGVLTFRPESVQLSTESDSNPIAFHVIEKTYLGSQTRLLGMVGDLKIQVLLAPSQASSIAIGANIYVQIARESLWVLRD
ncbi:MAG: ABC transporter ATP-binding protein [Paracoccaceae bacterium]